MVLGYDPGVWNRSRVPTVFWAFPVMKEFKIYKNNSIPTNSFEKWSLVCGDIQLYLSVSVGLYWDLFIPCKIHTLTSNVYVRTV